MKVFTRVLSFSLLFLTLFSQAQNNIPVDEHPIRELNDADFERAKSLCIKMADSPNWKKSDSISAILATKYWLTEPPDFENKTLYLSWIKENLHLTKFTSVDEAIFLENEWKKAGIEIDKENLPLYELLDKASIEQNKVIIKPILISK